MRKYYVIIPFLLAIQPINCQDIIKTVDKKDLNVRIIEMTDKYVKYKMPDNENGPVFSMKIRSVSTIDFKDNKIEPFINQNPRVLKRFGVNAGFIPGLSDNNLTLTLDYFVLPQIDVEVTFGSDFYRDLSYFSCGSRFHANSDLSNKRFTPFTGLIFGSSYEEQFFQIPVGLSFITKTGFSTSININGTIHQKNLRYLYYIRPQRTIVEFRLGWRFKV